MGRVDISARKWIKKAPPWCQQLRGVSNNIGGILVKVRGSGVKVRFWTPFWQGKVRFTFRQQPLNCLGVLFFAELY